MPLDGASANKAVSSWQDGIGTDLEGHYFGQQQGGNTLASLNMCTDLCCIFSHRRHQDFLWSLTNGPPVKESNVGLLLILPDTFSDVVVKSGGK